MTGKKNYREYGEDIGEDLLTYPERVETEFSADVAGWFWKKHGLNALADEDDILTITRIINGGYNGLNQRVSCLVQAKHALMKGG